MDVSYDVAISFLSQDEPLAVKICNELSENLRVFVYSKRQEELAGTDGLESFRKTFFSDSTLIVVLNREGWGKTRWTGIEELAIKDRMFNGGWESLLFVMLDESKPPRWLPTTHIRLSYDRYGEALIGAVKMRAQELGSVLKVETAMEKAKRVQSKELARDERDRLLTNDGATVVKREHRILCQRLDEKIADIKTQLTTIELEHGTEGQTYILRTDLVSLSFYLYTTAPVTKSCIVVHEFDAPLILPGSNRMYIPGQGPRQISKRKFFFDYHEAHGWCWKQSDSEENVLTTSSLAEYLLKSIFELHEQFRAGERVRRRETSGIRIRGTYWS